MSVLRFPLPDLPHPPQPPRSVHVEPPLVFVPPAWEYKHLVRSLVTQRPPDEAELNALGAKGWELVGTLVERDSAHFYFKRATR